MISAPRTQHRSRAPHTMDRGVPPIPTVKPWGGFHLLPRYGNSNSAIARPCRIEFYKVWQFAIFNLALPRASKDKIRISRSRGPYGDTHHIAHPRPRRHQLMITSAIGTRNIHRALPRERLCCTAGLRGSVLVAHLAIFGSRDLARAKAFWVTEWCRGCPGGTHSYQRSHASA